MERDVEVMVRDKAWSLEVTLDVRGGEDWKLKDNHESAKNEYKWEEGALCKKHFCASFPFLSLD